jgi:hypothetical protein
MAAFVILVRAYRTASDWSILEVISWIFAIAYFIVILQIHAWQLSSWFVLVGAFAITFVAASRMARHAAVGWGSLVKSSFDLFLPDLRQQLGFSDVTVGDRDLWDWFSQAIIYRKPEYLSGIKGEVEKESVEDKREPQYKDVAQQQSNRLCSSADEGKKLNDPVVEPWSGEDAYNSLTRVT